MKPFDYYSKSTTPYPVKQDYTTYYVYDKGEVIGKFAAWERSKAVLEGLFPNAVVQSVLDEDSFEAHQRVYREEQFGLEEKFQNDLFDEFGVSDNPKRHKCFSLAWENGHAHGHSEVYNHFSDYVELIQD
jgi:hypothetical protein